MIPQYIPQYNREEIAKRVSEYILGNDNFFSENEKTKEFEVAIANFLNVKHCITVTSGTMALSLALLAKGVKPGDKVLIPNITMMSTQAAVQLIGAVPVFIDVDPINLCMDLEQAKLWITIFEAKAVVYVSLNGRIHKDEQFLNMEKFCENNNVSFIMDNAQAFGSYFASGKPIATGLLDNTIGCFSLSFHKLLSTGQGGFCVTDNDELNIRLRQLKNVGRVNGGADVHENFGINCKFTDMQAIIGLVGLKDIKKNAEQKQFIKYLYETSLQKIEQVRSFETPSYCVPWFMDIYVPDREELQKHLTEKGIGTRAIYPELTSQQINHKLFHSKSLRVSGEYCKQGLWLPSSLDLEPEEIKYICNTIKEFYGK